MSKHPLFIAGRSFADWLGRRLLILLLAGSARASTLYPFPIGSIADAFVTTGPSDDLTGNNYGGGGSFGVSAADLPKGEFKSLLRFNLSPAAGYFDALFGSGGWVVDGVELELVVNSPTNALFNSPNAAGTMLMQWLQNDTWIEGNGTPMVANTVPGAVTWNDLGALTAAGVEALGTFSYGGEAAGTALQFALASNAGLSADVLGGSEASFLLSAASTGMTTLFNSRTFGTPSRRPDLRISASAVPEPGRLLLLLSACCCATLARRRR